MPSEIRVPTFGESVVEAVVGRWLKHEGEAVAIGEPLVELETEKVNTEVAADEAGVLSRILHKEGETVHPDDVLGVIEVRAETATTQPMPQAQTAAATNAGAQVAAPIGDKMRASPVAIRLAQELDVDLSKVPGTGPGGRISKEDVEHFHQRRDGQDASARVPQPEASPAAGVQAPGGIAPSRQTPSAVAVVAESTSASSRSETRERMSRRRLTIARRLVEAQRTAAMLTTFNEVDMSAVLDLRRRRREDFRRTTGADLGFMSFFVKGALGALKAFPHVNSELQGDELVIKHYYDIGIAIGVEEGLVVPVLRDADRLSFAAIERAISELAQRAREGALTLDELRGGTFTISNGGVFGSLFSTPILNPPQVGILGMHKTVERAVVVGGQVVVRPMMYVALTYDHRVIDGREAVLFLVRLKELIEDPERLMLEG